MLITIFSMKDVTNFQPQNFFGTVFTDVHIRLLFPRVKTVIVAKSAHRTLPLDAVTVRFGVVDGQNSYVSDTRGIQRLLQVRQESSDVMTYQIKPMTDAIRVRLQPVQRCFHPGHV